MRWCAAFLSLVSLMAAGARGAEATAVLVEGNPGSRIDDLMALAVLVASPEVEIRGVTTSVNPAEDRAWLVCRFLTHSGRGEVPVAYARKPVVKGRMDWQIQYRRHPAVIFHRTSKPVKASAVEFLKKKLGKEPGKVTMLAVGPATNVAGLLRKYPESAKRIERIIVCDSAWSDPVAEKTIRASAVPVIVVPSEVTVSTAGDFWQKLFAANTRLTHQIRALSQLADEPRPKRMHAVIGASLCVTDKYCKFRGDIDKPGKERKRVLSVRGERLGNWCLTRLTAGRGSLPRPPSNVSRVVERRGLPNRVHAFEDFETDIEKRWWMSGRVETEQVPDGSSRSCRAVLTQDFDDRMGDMKASYGAVVFNPVPGPPMGKNPRLSFRYWLKGTDTLRVQIYSLSKGYHRYLTIKGLGQGRWRSATVDMTKARRPDGSGGPLSEHERIDDIQFYVEPRAELFIDDIVLYDAAKAGESERFPTQIHFSGWFDTGRQGREWQGDFALVEDGYCRRAAGSVRRAKSDHPWIRLDLGGKRRLGAKTRLFLRYRLEHADGMRVELVHGRGGVIQAVELDKLKQGEWSEARVDFTSAGGGVKEGAVVDEIRFVLPDGAVLRIDDVLLYNRGGAG